MKNKKINKNMTIWKNYHEIETLSQIYFEDSYLIDICFSGATLDLKVLLVIMEKHSNYVPPKKGEQYCYVSGNLRFNKNFKLNEFIIRQSVSRDSDGEYDLGNIDTFLFSENHYLLKGDWGEIDFKCDAIALELNLDS